MRILQFLAICEGFVSLVFLYLAGWLIFKGCEHYAILFYCVGASVLAAVSAILTWPRGWMWVQFTKEDAERFATELHNKR